MTHKHIIKSFRFLSILCAFLFASQSAIADCSNTEDLNPGVSGDIEYFSSTNQLMYCDDNDEWILMSNVFDYNSLLLHLKLDEEAGSTANNSGSASINGSMTNITGGDTSTGAIGSSLSFDGGSGDYIQVADTSDFFDFGTSQNFSISAWVKTTATSVQQVISKYHSGATPGYYMQMSADGTVAAFIRDGVGGGTTEFVSITSTSTVNDGGWHHLTVTFDRDGNGILYIDGVAETTEDISVITTSIDNTQPVLIGRRGSGEYFDGEIDDVRIYSKNLTSDDVGELYSQAALKVGLVGHWKMDETSGSTVTDYSPYGNDGTNSNISTNTESGKIGNSLFYTYNTYATLVNTTDYNNIEEITIAYWAKPSQLRGYMYLLSYDGVDLSSDWNINNLRINFKRHATTLGSWRKNDLYDIDQWHHYAITYSYNDAIGTAPKLYIDGVAQTVSSASTPVGAFSPGSSTEIRIGHAGSSNHGFRGYLDDFRIYNRVLGAEEITALSACTNGGNFYFNDDAKAYQWCDGENVWNMGPSSEGSTSGTCTGTLSRGTMDYASGTYYYCPSSYAVPIGRKCSSCGGSATEKVVFVMTTGSNGNKGGLTGADATCQAEAENAGIEGTYMAWLADDTGSPSTRFSATARGGTVSFVRPDGTTVADDWSDLTDGTLDNAVNYTVYGDLRVSSIAGWFSNVNTDGTLHDGSYDCSDWTSDDSGLEAYRGSGGTAAAWTYRTGAFSTYYCNQSVGMLCFEQ